jgi:chromosome segregation ATPase
MRAFLFVFALFLPAYLVAPLLSACSDKETKQEYQAKVERELSKTDERINELEAKSRDATGDNKRNLEEQTRSLKDEREAAGRKLDQLRNAQGDDWKGVKRDLDKSLSSLNDRLSKAVNDLKK